MITNAAPASIPRIASMPYPERLSVKRLAQGPGAYSDHRNDGNRDGGADTHHESRDHTGPEQPLRESKDQY